MVTAVNNGQSTTLYYEALMDLSDVKSSGQISTDQASTLGSSLDAVAGGDGAISSSEYFSFKNDLQAAELLAPTTPTTPTLTPPNPMKQPNPAIGDPPSAPAPSEAPVSFNGGNGSDTIAGSLYADTLNGGGGADTVYAFAGDDVIKGGNGADLIYADEGNDNIKGGAGADTIVAWNGDDKIKGGGGSDTISVGAGSNKVNGGQGFDTVELDGNQADYKITQTGNNKFEVTDAAGNVNQLKNVESLHFGGGGTVNL
jgi:Ca2+-binding RTX toxin-like protein